METKDQSWFAVDRDGLRRIVAGRPKSFALFELLQNAFDADISRVDATLTATNDGVARLVVEDDDPNGFVDLSHAYTMYASSSKKNDPSKRGRFNIGEKLVLALCEQASITSTRGTIVFNADGTREQMQGKTKRGSRFEALLRIDQSEIDAIVADVALIQPPHGLQATFNGVALKARPIIVKTRASLPTVIADDQGVLRRAERVVDISVFETLPGETAMIYELGIPVVETGDRWHVDVAQKVPVNADRDNVPPAFLRKVRVAVLNATYGDLDKESAAAVWVEQAIADPAIDREAVKAVVTKRFGKRVVVRDPSDPEATNLAVEKGYAVLSGGEFNRAQWANIREAGAVQPAGRVFPTAKVHTSPDPNPANEIPEAQWSQGMRDVAALALRIVPPVVGGSISVGMVKRLPEKIAACYGGRRMTFCVERLGREWFNLERNLAAIVDVITHETSHEFAGNHLSPEFYAACTRVAGRFVAMAVADPTLFQSRSHA